MIKLIAKNQKRIRLTAYSFIGILALELLTPVTSYALTSGPSQPEVQSFEPISTTQMVDPFTGDFVYNIGLLDVGGYPINLSYHSGITNDQEASWVGLGWNINPGSLVRSLRGLPDDFNGEQVRFKRRARPVNSWALSKKLMPMSLETAGFDWDKLNPEKAGKIVDAILKVNNSEDKKINHLGITMAVTLNNYKGVGYNFGIQPINIKTKFANFEGQFNFSSQSGLGMNGAMNLQEETKRSEEDCDITLSNRAYRFGVGKSRNGLAVDARISNSSVTINEKTWDVQKNKQSGAGVLSSAHSTYYPGADPDYTSFSLSTSVRFGKEYTPGITTYGAPWTLDYSRQSLDAGSEDSYKSAYGYAYTEKGENDVESIMDVNRFNDGQYNRYSKFLNTTQHTYDPFVASGQGVSGVFRPYRNSVGRVWDNKSKSGGDYSLDLNSVDLGGGNGVKFGLDFMVSYGQSSKKRWDDDVFKNFQFNTENASDEPYYYKSTADMSVSNKDFYESLGWENPVNLAVENLTGWTPLQKLERSKREVRNKVLSVLNVEQAKEIALDKAIKMHGYLSDDSYTTPALLNYYPTFTHGWLQRDDYATDNFNSEDPTDILTDVSKQYSEMTVTQEDGSRYVYGLPLINHKHVETTFAMGQQGISSNDLTGLLFYDKTKDNQFDQNDKGIDNYVSRKEIPEYAHGFMLTAVLSADYVDVTGDGPTEDDLGNYTKFNYAKTNSKFKWRTPMTPEVNKGNHQKGLNCTDMDDKGSYVYGEKDIWLVHSIETKTHIAMFYLSERLDGLGAIDENGGVQKMANRLRKLDKIELYTKDEVNRNPTNPVPLKTVHFEYSYDLCPNVPNNYHHGVSESNNEFLDIEPDPQTNVVPIPHPLKTYDGSKYNRAINQKKGKLTLHKVYFTYGKSLSGQQSPYIFEYGDGVLNPDYGYKNSDRWGNYKPNDYQNQGNIGFPYVTQDKALADEYASAWLLNSIRLPSGGKILIDYESDDYAYIQDKKAMQMITVDALGHFDENDDLQFNLNSVQRLYNQGDPNNVLLFELPSGQTADDYLKDLKYLYFRFKMDLGSGLVPSQYEYVPGFVEIESYGEHVDNSTTYAYVKIKSAEVDKPKGIFPWSKEDSNKKYKEKFKNANPISKIGWQFTRTYTPWIAFPGSDYKNSTLDGATKTANVLFGIVPEAVKNVTGYQRAMMMGGKSRDVEMAKSIIRVNNPTGFKYGGGTRVRKVEVNDNWSSMTSNESSHSYGQIYSYTTTDEQGKTISSGVASWEPLTGGDENSHRQPILRIEKNIWAPDNNLYNTLPIGEELYPSPIVGYSKVITRNLNAQDLGYDASTLGQETNTLGTTTNRGTGLLVQEFYTAKDYPTISRQTTIKRNKLPKVPTKWLTGSEFDHAKASQGFVVELNDMHGKLKSTTALDVKGNIKTESQYFYQSADVGTTAQDHEYVKSLRNKVHVLNRDGKVEEHVMGYEMEMVVDGRHSEDFNGNVQVSPNIDALFPAFIPSLHVWGGVQHKSIKTTSITKVVQRKGILKRVKVTQDGASLETENLAYDKETGQVLLSRIGDEFNNYQYSLNIPAYWAYERMGGAYTNIGAKQTGCLFNSNNGTASLSGDIPFVKGDEVLVYNEISKEYTGHYWILDLHEIAGTPVNTTISVVDRFGASLGDGTYTLRVIRSGNRNLQSASIGTMVLQDNPIQPDGSGGFVWQTYNHSNAGVLSDQVLIAGAMQFTENRSQYPNKLMGDVPDYCENVDEYTCEANNNVVDTRELDIMDPAYLFSGKIVNPYVAGILGTWSPLRSLVFNNKLEPYRTISPDIASNSNNFNHSDISKDGAYKEFEYFWTYNGTTDLFEPGSTDNNLLSNKWSWVETSGLIDPNGLGLLSTDALGINSSAQYGYNRLLPVAVANNAQTNEMVFDGFEDYNGLKTIYFCNGGNIAEADPQWEPILKRTHHWYIWRNFMPTISELTNETTHTGRYSLKLTGKAVDVEMSSIYPTTVNSGTPMTEYRVQKGDLVPWFKPESGEYILSFWYKLPEPAELIPGIPEFVATPPAISMTYDQSPGNTYTINITNEEHGDKINGWQRYTCKFNIPAGVNVDKVNLKIINTSPTDTQSPITACTQRHIYLDDFRVHPSDGNMKSFVYDQLTNRLMATLDENNYATFYEYDEEGNLIRTKVETERGIYTIQENRSNTVKINH